MYSKYVKMHDDEDLGGIMKVDLNIQSLKLITN